MKSFRLLAITLFAAALPLHAAPTLTFLDTFGAKGAGKFDFPYGIAVDAPAACVYVTDFTGDRVESFDTVGKYKAQWGAAGAGDGQFDGPGGIAVRESSGHIYVTDILNNRIEHFDGDGVFRTSWGSKGICPGNSTVERHCDQQKTGVIYVCEQGNNRVQYFDAKGSWLGMWGAAARATGSSRPPMASR